MQRRRCLVFWLKLRERHVGSGVDPCPAATLIQGPCIGSFFSKTLACTCLLCIEMAVAAMADASRARSNRLPPVLSTPLCLPPQSVQEASARAVGSMLSGLLNRYPTNQHAACTDVYALGGNGRRGAARASVGLPLFFSGVLANAGFRPVALFLGKTTHGNVVLHVVECSLPRPAITHTGGPGHRAVRGQGNTSKCRSKLSLMQCLLPRPAITHRGGPGHRAVCGQDGKRVPPAADVARACARGGALGCACKGPRLTCGMPQAWNGSGAGPHGGISSSDKAPCIRTSSSSKAPRIRTSSSSWRHRRRRPPAACKLEINLRLALFNMKPAQVEFAHALVEAQLLAPARRLKELAASGGEEANKERLKGLLMQVGAVCASLLAGTEAELTELVV